jgi:hypothetical protein
VIYDVVNTDTGLRQALQCGGVKPDNGIPSLPFLIIGFPIDLAIQI